MDIKENFLFRNWPVCRWPFILKYLYKRQSALYFFKTFPSLIEANHCVSDGSILYFSSNCTPIYFSSAKKKGRELNRVFFHSRIPFSYFQVWIKIENYSNLSKLNCMQNNTYFPYMHLCKFHPMQFHPTQNILVKNVSINHRYTYVQTCTWQTCNNSNIYVHMCV